MKMKMHFNEFSEQYCKENAYTLYCVYCAEPKGNQLSCCGDVDFLEFRHFDYDTQMALLEEEYTAAFGAKK